MSPDQASKRPTPHQSPERPQPRDIIYRNPSHVHFERLNPAVVVRGGKDYIYLKSDPSKRVATSMLAYSKGEYNPKYEYLLRRDLELYPPEPAGSLPRPSTAPSKRSLNEIPANQDTQYPHSSDSAPPPSVSNLPPEKLPSATEISEEEKLSKEVVDTMEQELKREANLSKYDGTEATGGKLPEKTVAGLPLGNVGEFADRIPTQYKTDDDGKILLDMEAMEQRKAYEKAMKPVAPEPTGEILKLLKEINTRELLKASEKEKREALKAKMRKRFTVFDKDYYLKY